MTKIFAVITVIALAGCVPVKVSETRRAGSDAHFTLDGSYGLLSIGDFNQPKSVVILPRESFAVGPDGKKYRIEVQPHDYDLEKRYAYVRDQIYVVGDSGRRIKNLQTGSWRFTISFEKGSERDIRVFDVELRTLYYNPIIHGPPN